jgi:hypothetical protein
LNKAAADKIAFISDQKEKLQYKKTPRWRRTSRGAFRDNTNS